MYIEDNFFVKRRCDKKYKQYYIIERPIIIHMFFDPKALSWTGSFKYFF